MVGFGPADVPPTAAVKFVGAGTAACIADLVTFPLDTAKVRLQVSSVMTLALVIFVHMFLFQTKSMGVDACYSLVVI